MDKIAVLVPCYNESQTIKNVVEDFKRVLPEATVYVYDNNSTDGTDEIARAAGAVVRYERQQGKGSVIRRMFREIDAEVYVNWESLSTVINPFSFNNFKICSCLSEMLISSQFLLVLCFFMIVFLICRRILKTINQLIIIIA